MSSTSPSPSMTSAAALSTSSVAASAQPPHFYHYDPSSVLAIIALTFFAATTSLHAFQLFFTRTWYFLPFLAGGLLEVIGYIFRLINANQTPWWTRGPFIGATIGILISPAFLAASMYILLGRIIRLTDGDSRSFIKQNYMTGIFVTGDVASLVIQAAGGGFVTSTNPNTIKIGQYIIDAGLFVQIISFGIFLVTALTFQFRIEKHPTQKSADSSIPWRKHMYILYMSSCLIFGRCIFRVAEFLQGVNGTISSSETLFYIFDSLFVFIVMVSFNIVHPSEVRAYLHGSGRIAWRGHFERLLPVASDQRSFELHESGPSGKHGQALR